MADITPGVRAISGVFGKMFDAVWDGGFSTTNMWDAFKGAYQALGQERPPASIFDMNTYRTWLNTLVSSARALGAAADTDALGGRHWANPLGYTPNAADAANPRMLATFEVTISTEAGEVTRWASTTYNTLFPATVGELRSDAAASVQLGLDMANLEEGNESETAGGQVVGLGRMYVTVQGV